MTTYKDDQAFPISGFRGLTKREYFAGQALQGVLAELAMPGQLPKPEVVRLAVIAYADVCIAALNGTSESS